MEGIAGVPKGLPGTWDPGVGFRVLGESFLMSRFLNRWGVVAVAPHISFDDLKGTR